MNQHVTGDGAENWLAINLTFGDYSAAEHIMMTAVWPVLRGANVDRWWYVREQPHWRLRLRPTATLTRAGLLDQVAAALAPILGRRVIETWSVSHYEPEWTGFGGPDAMRIVHDLFHADSNGYLEFRNAWRNNPNQSPDLVLISLLITTHLFRAAGVDAPKQGDIWAHLADLAPIVSSAPGLEPLTATASAALRADLHQLTATDPKFSSVEAWAMNIHERGRALGELWETGTREAVICGILARIVTLHWNRIDLHEPQGWLLAKAARDAILGGAE